MSAVSPRRAAMGPWARAVVAVLLVAGAVAALVLAVGLPASDPGPAAATARVTVALELSPGTALFGDPLTAEVGVTLPEEVDPDSVRVRADFRPYAAAATTDRDRVGDTTLVRARFALLCLTEACLPGRGGTRTFRFPPAEVAYARDGAVRRLSVPWDEVRVGSRLGTDGGRLRLTPPAVDRATWVPAGATGGVLLAGAALVGLAGAWLVLTGLWPRSFRSRRPTPLEQALEQLETAAQDGDEETRRRVLDQLATRLGEVDEQELERRSRELAWSERTPGTPELELLGREIAARTNGGLR